MGQSMWDAALIDTRTAWGAPLSIIGNSFGVPVLGSGAAGGATTNNLVIAGSSTGQPPTITASGSDTNIGIRLVPKGSGQVSVLMSPSSIGSGVFTGTGLSDATFGGTYTNTGVQTLRVQIVTAGTPDQFQWSSDAGVTWSTIYNLTGAAQPMNYTGVTVQFAATTGHTVGDFWTVVCTPAGGNLTMGNVLTLGNVYNFVAIGPPYTGWGGSNIWIGYQSFNAAKCTGSQNIAIGTTAMSKVTIASYNIAIGWSALANVTTGLTNVAVGVNSLAALTTGVGNACYGTSYQGDNKGAGYALTTGQYNTFCGCHCGIALTTGNENTILGHNALNGSIIGSSNVAVGSSAGAGVQGDNNICIGAASGATAGTSGNNVAIGTNAMRLGVGNSNVMIGYAAGYSQATPSNLFIVGNIQQANAANDLTYSLLTGAFAGVVASVANQYLNVNGRLAVNTNSPKSNLHVTGIAVYANNAAAITGGLTAGAVYRNGADPDLLCIVH